MKRLVLVLAVVLASRGAGAAMMEHYDLAGLVLRSESIAIVDRIAPGRYHVVARLRGSIATGIELALEDSLYDFPIGTDTRMYAFLAKRGIGYELVPSGLRIVVGGKVDRYEQRNNPGGWSAVAQGEDPRDEWQGSDAAITPATLTFAIGDAVRRVALLPLVRAERDQVKRRAAALALLAPRGDARSTEFYVDALAAEVRDLLVAGGDLEGALLADQRDHGETNLRPDFATVKALVGYASDPSHPSELRAHALAAAIRSPMQVINDPQVAEQVIALLAEPDPAVRAAAVPVAGLVATTAGDPDSPATTSNREAAKTALASRYRVETEPDVLYALANSSALDPAPAKAAPPAVARVGVRNGKLAIDVICLAPSARADNVKLTAIPATGNSLLGSTMAVHCRGFQGSDITGMSPMPLPSHFALTLELAVDGKHFAQRLGTIAFDATGELVLSR